MEDVEPERAIIGRPANPMNGPRPGRRRQRPITRELPSPRSRFTYVRVRRRDAAAPASSGKKKPTENPLKQVYPV